MAEDVVHWLENVGADPEVIRTACKRFEWWTNYYNKLLDTNRKQSNPVTCPECLKAMKRNERYTSG